MNPKEKCLIVLDVADEKKMQDVVILDLRDVFPVADYWVIGSAATFIQTKAIAEEIKKTLDSYSVQPFHIEGFDVGEWILMDKFCQCIKCIYYSVKSIDSSKCFLILQLKSEQVLISYKLFLKI
jgi:ribosome-associated protein